MPSDEQEFAPPGAFLTGSQVYGQPSPESDIDLVVVLPEDVIELLRDFEDRHEDDMDEPPGSHPPGTASLCFGRLNLICLTDAGAQEMWWNATQDLKYRKEESGVPTTREEAIAHFDQKRREYGLS